ncbi:N-acyl homoserine lactonase family protein [Seongchinamella unica]|uniref:N-acyl homoserine lactonase family protein n=1 Tax=Seongchinamella unica TaxID=2547392 RepID=A0A4R5LR69_9GAMM|nr:N-acyl homoserine lactonase family protein [Seongchinamella unica]TDG13331.1 N-acyl homoserine lactonase family protein [Seongchinamella unica]
MKYVLSLLLLLSLPVQAGPKLYVFDCGLIKLESLELFNLKPADSPVREMVVPCFLVEHAKGRLLFDGGLPRHVADSAEPVAIEGGSLVYDRWILDQLADMGLVAGDIDFAAYSHLHFDHAGAANSFVDSTVLMQQREWDAAFTQEQGFIDVSLVEGLKQADVRFVDGDHDVFGDGTVQLILAPGHTPGHQLLLLELESRGKILLSGDLYHTQASRKLRRVPTFNSDEQQTYASMDRIEALLKETGATLWIEHDKSLFDTLKKAPDYYD